MSPLMVTVVTFAKYAIALQYEPQRETFISIYHYIKLLCEAAVAATKSSAKQ